MIIVFRGRYDINADYNKLDVVIYNNKFFLCITEHTHTNPQLPVIGSDTDYWATFGVDSTFPEQIDQFITRTNIQASDIPNIERYQELKLKENRTPQEDDELNNLTNLLRDKLIAPEDWNKFQAALQNMQMFIKSEVEGYINQKQTEFQAEIDKFMYKGIYNPSTQYYEKNYVTYNDGTGDNIFICIKDALGIEPTDTAYWKKLGIKGEKGNDGVGLVFKGAWNNSVIYDVNDAVQYGGIIFGCLEANINQPPDISQDTQYWAKAWDIAITTTKLIGTRSITSNVSNINFITGEITSFNPNTDSLEVYKNSVRLTKNIDYVINADNQSIDKVGGTWDGTSTPIFFEFVVTRNQINNLVFSDGQTIQEGTISKSKLTVDLQNEIDVVNDINLESTGYGVISGLNVTAQATPDMTVNVNSGIVHMLDGDRLTPSGNSTVSIDTADATNPRIDIIYVDTDASIGYVAGTPAISPSAPATPLNTFLLAEIYVGAGVTSITNNDITDKRKMKYTLDNDRGISNFAGNGNEVTIAHQLGTTPSYVNVTPIENPNGYLGETWVRSDSNNIYVGNSGSFTGQFKWIVIK